MASLVRASKFRHVYCDAPRIDATFQNFRLSTTTGEQSYIKANDRYFAISTQGGGGPVAIIPLDKPGRAPAVLPVVSKGSLFVLYLFSLLSLLLFLFLYSGHHFIPSFSLCFFLLAFLLFKKQDRWSCWSSS
jgi:hypothetical protein